MTPACIPGMIPGNPSHFLSRALRLHMLAGRPAASAAATSLSEAHSSRSGWPKPAACRAEAWEGCMPGTCRSTHTRAARQHTSHQASACLHVCCF